jgi:chorismate mutase/prephenate dehydratase
MSSLKSLRSRIDRVDEQLLETLAERMALVEEVLRGKEATGGPLFDPERERDLLRRFAEGAERRHVDPAIAERIFREVVSCSRELQSRMLHRGGQPALEAEPAVAYQGSEGAYSWIAIRQHFPDGARALGCATFGDAIASVEEGSAEMAMLPVENTIHGSVHEVYDSLTRSRLHVIGEEIVRIEHCLLGVRTASERGIRKVLSHPIAIQQCTAYLRSLRGTEVEVFVDTAEAARKVAEEGDPTLAAIASRTAASLHGLSILREGIEDDRKNYTRFWLLAREPIHVDPRLPARTALVLDIEHREGALVRCLSSLARRGINLTKLESRPILGRPWEYRFFLELVGNAASDEVQSALAQLRDQSREVRVLGCYPQLGSAPESVARISAGSAEPSTPASRAVAAVAPPAVTEVPAAPGGTPLFSRERSVRRSTVTVGNVEVGAGRFVVMAGPCAVESGPQIERCARMVRELGGDILRGGGFKPRTSPYAFQGLGMEGVRMLEQAGREQGLPVVSEVTSIEHAEEMALHVDLLQVGARNMQNMPLLRALGRLDRPILLKRGLMSTIDELLLAAEYILMEGNRDVILCERGIRTFETATRNTLDLSAVVVLRERTHLPIIVDPSHAAGKACWVPPLCRAAKAVGADGIIVEVHTAPAEALCDREQALAPEVFEALIADLASMPDPAHGRAGTT